MLVGLCVSDRFGTWYRTEKSPGGPGWGLGVRHPHLVTIELSRNPGNGEEGEGGMARKCAEGPKNNDEKKKGWRQNKLFL